MAKLTHEQKIEQLKEAAVIQAEYLYNYNLIARAIGKTDDTLKAWRDDDEEFSERLEQARVRFLHKRIKNAKPEFLLERLEPEIFKRTDATNINIHMPQPILGGESKKFIEAEPLQELDEGE